MFWQKYFFNILKKLIKFIGFLIYWISFFSFLCLIACMVVATFVYVPMLIDKLIGPTTWEGPVGHIVYITYLLAIYCYCFVYFSISKKCGENRNEVYIILFILFLLTICSTVILSHFIIVSERQSTNIIIFIGSGAVISSVVIGGLYPVLKECHSEVTKEVLQEIENENSTEEGQLQYDEIP
jgi:hypothetical protein